MKKYIAILLSLVLVFSLFVGCSKKDSAAEEVMPEAATAVQDSEAAEEEAASDAASEAPSGADADTASAFYGAYIEAKSNVVTKIMNGLGNNPDTVMTALSFIGATMSDLYLLPAMYFGLDESSVAAALAVMGAKNVVYEKNGNSYSISYLDSNDQDAVLTGTYDAGKSLICVGSTNGTENVFSEVYKTAFGYVGQFYYIADDGTTTLYQFAISGEDGVVGMVNGGERPAALSGSESADFAASAPEWYAINGSTITGVASDGTSINFEYVPSEDDE